MFFSYLMSWIDADTDEDRNLKLDETVRDVSRKILSPKNQISADVIEKEQVPKYKCTLARIEIQLTIIYAV